MSPSKLCQCHLILEVWSRVWTSSMKWCRKRRRAEVIVFFGVGERLMDFFEGFVDGMRGDGFIFIQEVIVIA